jgi:two-component system, sensor histidine kinase ChiS
MPAGVRLWIKTWIALGWLCCASALGAESLRVERLFNDDSFRGQTIGGVVKILQDPQGFMWLGGEGGLARYDGVNFRRYSSNPKDPKALPSSYVRDMLLDTQGVLWIATESGLVRYNALTDSFETIYRDSPIIPGLPSNLVTSMTTDTQGNIYMATAAGLVVLGVDRKAFVPLLTQANPRPADGFAEAKDFAFQRVVWQSQGNILWIGAVNRGLVRFSLADSQLQVFAHDPQNPASLPDNHVRSIALDATNRIWVGTNTAGAARLDPTQGAFKRYPLGDAPGSFPAKTVWSVFCDSRGNLWFGTDHGGLAKYLPDTDSFAAIRHNAYDNNSLSSNQVRSVFEDKYGDLWIGTYPSGVNYYNQATDLFTNSYHKPDNPNSLPHNAVLSLLEDSTGTLWVGTEGGLSAIDPRTGQYRHYRKNLKDPKSLQADAVITLFEDSQKRFWVGTWGGGLHRLDRQTGTFTHYAPQPGNPNSLGSLYVWRLVEDDDGSLWIATEKGGLNRFDPKTERFEQYLSDNRANTSILDTYVWTLFKDKSGTLWVGTTAGLARFDTAARQFHHYPKSQLEATRIRAFAEDSRGRLWIGSQDSGVHILDSEREHFTRLSLEDGLPATHVASIVEDNQANIWLATSNGLVRVDGQSLKMRIYQQSQGLPGNNFNRDASIKSRSGTLYFGSTEGFSAFDPKSLAGGQYDYPVVLTELKLFNQTQTPTQNPGLLPKAIEYIEQLQLPHEQNMLTLGFAGLNYRDARYIHYSYKLDGLDDKWHDAGAQAAATYTNLSPGHYRFRVRAANRDGQWSPQEVDLKIRIMPPWWRTPWAYSAYGILTLGLAYGLFFALWRQMEWRAQKALNQQLIELDKSKDAFLAHTSHELRTPLNGIIGMADALLDENRSQLPAPVVQRLSLISFSGKRLSHLINDILDYAKLKEHRLTLYKSPVSPHAAVQTVFELLSPLAEGKGLALRNLIEPSTPELLVDPNRLQQILINLVGNAIKYTDQGDVSVHTSCKDGSFCLHVTDTGIGIAPQQQAQLFQAFNQLDAADDRRQGGSGLGLVVTQHLVELHGGHLRLQSSPGQGSCFTLCLPQQTQLAASGGLRGRSGPTPNPTPQVMQEMDGAVPVPLACVMIVDDDPVNRLVLESMLKPQGYDLITAASGSEALALLQQRRVDLIILDVIMPGMNGYDTCQQIRHSHPIEELPIIFLTANRVDDEVMSGYNAGGNEFLSKPVSKAELLPRVANHLRLLHCYRTLKHP